MLNVQCDGTYKMLFNEEGSSVDCTIKDTKLQKEEQEGRESRGLKGFYSSSVKH